MDPVVALTVGFVLVLIGLAVYLTLTGDDL